MKKSTNNIDKVYKHADYSYRMKGIEDVFKETFPDKVSFCKVCNDPLKIFEKDYCDACFIDLLEHN